MAIEMPSLLSRGPTVVAADERVLVIGLIASQDLAAGDIIAHGE